MVKTVEPSSSKTSARMRRRIDEVSDRRCVSPTVPQFHGSLRPVIEALVVAVDEQYRVGARLQPGDIGAFLGEGNPRKAKVAGDDEMAIAGKTIAKLPVAELLHVVHHCGCRPSHRPSSNHLFPLVRRKLALDLHIAGLR